MNGAESSADLKPHTLPAIESGSRTVELHDITVAKLLLRYLAMEGVTKIFGVPGGAIMFLLDELRLSADVFDYVVCRHETGAAYMADGFARVGGGLGVVLVTSGPGATNALTGSMNALCSSTSLLTISGEVSEKYFGKGYLQEGIDAELDVDAVYRAASGYSAVIDSPSNFCTLFEQALRDARSTPGRATHVSLPLDVSSAKLDSVKVPASPANYRTAPRGVEPGAAEQILTDLLAADRPLVFVGNGARRPLQGYRLESLLKLLDHFAIPFMTTPDGKGLLPESHALSLRNYGLAACNWTSAYLSPPPDAPRFDCLVVMGSTLGELATSPRLPAGLWDPQLMPAGPFTQVDLDPAVIGRALPVDRGVVADIGPTVDEMVRAAQNRVVPDSAAERREWIVRMKQLVAPAPPGPESTEGPVHPIHLMEALNERLPPGAQVFVDAGNCVGWSLAYLRVDPPTACHSALAMGPMGFAVGAVVGAKIAAPEKVCVAVTGDGALLMHGSEISTAAANQVGAIWVVLSDNDLAMVSQGMQEFFPGAGWTDYYSLGKPDLAGFATSLGAQGIDVFEHDELKPALDKAIADSKRKLQPQVIVVHIDPKPVPPYYGPVSTGTADDQS